MIAVTGATGLVGSYIVRTLHKNNIPFVALRRSGSDLSALSDLQDKINWREADITDPVSLQQAFQDVTGVIHAAGYVSFNPHKTRTIFQINTEGTRHVVNACLAGSVKRLLHISSIAALGRQKDQTLLNEENKWVNNTFNGQYAESKYKAELEVFRGQEEGLSTVIVNPSVILGFSNWDKSSTQLFKYVWKEKPFYINRSLNYVDVRDVADCCLQLFNGSFEGERYILNAGTVPLKTFFDKTAAALMKKAPGIKVNATLARILAEVELLRCRIMRAEPFITRETARSIDTHFQYDNQKVKKALNFSFQTIDATLQWCCEQYTLQHRIKK
ncbi:MAG: NAD-dependent epimerase/dehydratase family protein [Cyclobacteriaceae bacterium]